MAKSVTRTPKSATQQVEKKSTFSKKYLFFPFKFALDMLDWSWNGLVTSSNVFMWTFYLGAGCTVIIASIFLFSKAYIILETICALVYGLFGFVYWIIHGGISLATADKSGMIERIKSIKTGPSTIVFDAVFEEFRKFLFDQKTFAGEHTKNFLYNVGEAGKTFTLALEPDLTPGKGTKA